MADAWTNKEKFEMKDMVAGLKHLFSKPINAVLIVLVGIMGYLGGLFTKDFLPILKVLASTIPPVKLLILGILVFLAAVIEGVLLYHKYNEDMYENAFGAFWKYNKRSKGYENYPYCPHCKSALTNYRHYTVGPQSGRYAFDCVNCKTAIYLADNNSVSIPLDNAHKMLKSYK